jgi:hypothetical protein
MNSDSKKIIAEIEELRSIVQDLRTLSQGIPALDRNLIRIAASVRMLELNFVDPVIEGNWRSRATG